MEQRNTLSKLTITKSKNGPLTTHNRKQRSSRQKEIDKILEEAIKPILKKYKTAGWNVKWYSSHGGGYQFTPKQETTEPARQN